jgi:hypothetical protein
MRSYKLYTVVEKDSPRGLKPEDVSVFLDGTHGAIAKKLYRVKERRPQGLKRVREN